MQNYIKLLLFVFLGVPKHPTAREGNAGKGATTTTAAAAAAKPSRLQRRRAQATAREIIKNQVGAPQEAPKAQDIPTDKDGSHIFNKQAERILDSCGGSDL